uniref:CCHC-type domain-containing protein n=1 Tax=Strongyloides venezuelensis TaxID=75913 RepID=A0A0K0G5Q4_STRVS
MTVSPQFGFLIKAITLSLNHEELLATQINAKKSQQFSYRRSCKPTKCFYCDKLGHVEADCLTKERNLTQSSNFYSSQISQPINSYRSVYNAPSKPTAVNSKPRNSTKSKYNRAFTAVNSVELDKVGPNRLKTVVFLTIQDIRQLSLWT